MKGAAAGSATDAAVEPVPGLTAPWPWYAPDEIQAVRDTLTSGRVNYWTGQEAREFEKEYAAAAGARHAIALANGTVALELALLAFGIGSGDEVVTTPRTFIASASAAIMRGATPVLADVDRETQNITAATIEPCLTSRTRAIIVVHLAGWPCEMDAIVDLAKSRGLIVIEDCAQANGARYRNRPIGSLGHAGAFSFCQDKIITTGGEGGLLTLDDDDAWSRAWAFKDHGKSHEAVYGTAHPPGFRWLHHSFGTNWRMTEMQAAIGRVQLRKLAAWVATRRRHAAILIEQLAGLEAARVAIPPAHIHHAYYRFYFFVRREVLRAGWSRERIVAEIAARGVPCFTGSCSEIYLEKAFTDAALGPPQRLPVARELGETSVALLVHPTLTEAQILRCAEVVREVLRNATR